jgi:hypothetical protein
LSAINQNEVREDWRFALFSFIGSPRLSIVEPVALGNQ